MYICLCNGITDREIRQCAASGVCSMPELECSLGIGVSCGRCREAAVEILEEFRSPVQTGLRPALAA
jgi:bacterioferritin-associated ferredoxin